ncbi:MAG: hypothetical protein OXC09_01640 [Truepera sp.]|nr:hypothetical protein [Truepera sp.]
MADSYPELRVEQKDGNEQFHIGGSEVGFALLDYWRWSGSDLINNIARGIFAGYIVVRALKVSTTGVRNEWAAFDLETQSGIKIEVKSSAYIQSWSQKRLSTISFGTPKTRAWSPESGYSPDLKHQADIYVFALLKHQCQETIDPLDLDQWEFYVLSTMELEAREGSPARMSLGTLAALASPVAYRGLAEAVQEAFGQSWAGR